VTLTIDGIPFQHKHATRKGEHCLGDACVGKFTLLSLEDAQRFQTHEERYADQDIVDLARRIKQ
jgi:hypothetical protein